MPDFAALRDAMVDRQIAGRGIRSAPLLAAMRKVPRELFVPEAIRDFAYEDGPLPIEAGQTISQPYIVALMIEAAGVAPAGHVLEIGADWQLYELGPVRFVPLIGEAGWRE